MKKSSKKKSSAGAFLWTVFLCLGACALAWGWQLLKNVSYEPVIIANETPVSQSTLPSGEISAQGSETPTRRQEEARSVKVCFLTDDEVVRFVDREVRGNSMYNIIHLLLAGPTKEERKAGLYSEIPSGVRVLSVREEGGNLIINLSENFAQGGGSASIMNRILQLEKTVKAQGTQKPVYLYLNGKRVEYIGGEGVYLEQPLNF
jgi:spore germination protein GerM